MERADIAYEYKDIIGAANKVDLPEVEVMEQVMGRITELENRRSPFFKRALRNTTVLGSVFTLILMISVTAYAASEYIQIRNKAGLVKVQFVAPNMEGETSGSYNKFAKQVQDFAKPGELIAYYVKRNLLGASEKTLQFEYKEKRIASYSDFSDEIKRTGAPEFPEAVGGYSFDYGIVAPDFPVSDADKESYLYRDTLSELTAQAFKDINGNNIFMKAIPWTKPGSISGIYSQGRARIGVFATLLHTANMFVEQEAENKADKVNVAGTEVVYNHVDKESVSYEYLNWYNEEQDAYYTLTSYGKKLNKEQLLQVARGLLSEKSR